MAKQLTVYLLISLLLSFWGTRLHATETLGWQDLLPDLDSPAALDDSVPWGERIRTDLNKKAVRIPGFIVPLEYDEQTVTSFLLVPYFGACIHEPPPPPNQTVYAIYEPGHEMDAMWQPVWVEGKIYTTRVEGELATASYSINAEKIELYE